MDNNSYSMIFGHKMPDTDSVCSAIALAELKNRTGEPARPYVLGRITRETEFALKYFDVECPPRLDNVKVQVKDLDYEKCPSVSGRESVRFAYDFMNANKLRTLPITDDEGRLAGIVTMKDIAMSLINSGERHLATSYANIIEALDGREVMRLDDTIDGEITVAAFDTDTLKANQAIDSHSIVIVGDRYDVIDYAIELKVRLVVLTGGLSMPDYLLEKAALCRVNIIGTDYKTYYTAKNIGLSKYVDSIMVSDGLKSFTDVDYLDYCREVVEISRHSKFPVVGRDKIYLGVLSRNDLINPRRKKVVLVDHNEYSQSADGIEEADIVEVIDHHKIGSITTSLPISFCNIPLGSTNTIIYNMYRERQLSISPSMAGLMLSGIISDTMFMKSPTTTSSDKAAIIELSEIAGVDAQSYAMDMFKAGTTLKGRTTEDILTQDFKKFVLEFKNIGISQVFTLNIDEIDINRDEYVRLIELKTKQDGYFMIIMAVTDIIQEGSYIYYTPGREGVLRSAFKKDEVYQGMYMDMYVSRKKQIVPDVARALAPLLR